MKEMPDLRETHILDRGHYENRGKVVHRATPAVLTPFPDRCSSGSVGLGKMVNFLGPSPTRPGNCQSLLADDFWTGTGFHIGGFWHAGKATLASRIT